MQWAFFAKGAEELAAADWPQFMGPNRDGVMPGSPKLMDAWPKEGLKLLWKSDALPAAPACGIGNPIVAGGKVYTYANTLVPIPGNMPFNAEFLTSWGWVAELPNDLAKKIDEPQFKDPKRKACKTNEEIEAYTKEFLGTLDPAEAKKFGDAIRIRIQRGGEAFNSADLAFLASYQNKEVKTRQEYWTICLSHFPGNMWHYWMGPLLSRCGDKMFEKQQSSDTIICLNAATGKELWRKEIVVPKAPYSPGNGSVYGYSGTPAIVKDKVYFAGCGGVYCLDAKKNGELVWQGKGEPCHTSPLVIKGVAYFMAGELAAFNADTGQELWRQPQVKNVYSSPAAWMHEDKTYLLCSAGAPDPTVICCVDPANGKVLWQTGSGLTLNQTPTTAGDIMVLRGKNGIAAFKISPQKAEPLWKGNFGDAGSNSVIYQDHVYCCGRTYSNDLVFVLDLKTGATTLHQVCAHGATCATPIVADGKVYTLESDNLTAFKTVAEKFELVGSMPQKPASCSSPAIADGRLYVRLTDSIVCYDLMGR
jgi:outer membrane protein assembly factor BamB